MPLRTTILAILTVAIGSSCARGNAPTISEDPAPMAAPSAVTAVPRTDAEITAAVLRDLARDPAIDSDEIDVDTTAGVVALDGRVRDLRSAERAAEIAIGIGGVRVVANDLQVVPVPRTDDEVAQSIETALRHDPTTWSGDLDVEVASGRVTLRGTVASLAVRNAAERKVEATPGVTALENLVVVDLPRNRTDAEIAPAVTRRLHADPKLDAARIIVTVHSGAVRLTGAVGSADEWRRAARGAWVDGVRAVDATGLEVRWWLDDTVRDDVPPRTPAEIAAAFSTALRLDPRVRSAEIVAIVRGDVVTLRGQVDRQRTRAIVEKLARNTVGVTAVASEILVAAAQPSDLTIQGRIERQLAIEPVTAALEIYVSAVNGRVVLGGTVDSTQARTEAQRIAAAIPGVLGVDNRLDVRDTERSALGGWTSTGGAIVASDAEITEAIAARIQADPGIDASAILVEVNDASATLTGYARTWSERDAAVEAAFVAGARTVIDDLRVGAVAR